MYIPSLKLSYTQLPDSLYAYSQPERSPAPERVLINAQLARDFNLLEWLKSDSALNLLTGQIGGTPINPIAMAYSGHQFGHLSPQLGDGRALLVAEIETDAGEHYDLHLKGSGRTPYSRGGDGKATLRAALKEYLFSESLAALNIPTSRSLAVLLSGERVYREAAHKGAILVRTARSHIRVGTFQFAALSAQQGSVKSLADFIIARAYKGLADLEEGERYRELFAAVISRQARLIADWMSHGFIHGVMNTDNMAISGETIDFGPCAFMDSFNSTQVFSSIDQTGRYAWNRQAEIAFWNLTRLAEAMLPLFGKYQDRGIEIAKAELEKFNQQFFDYFQGDMCSKLGFLNATDPVLKLIAETFELMQEQALDFTLFFHYLSDVAETNQVDRFLSLDKTPGKLAGWLEVWSKTLSNEGQNGVDAARTMRSVNPLYIPRTHLVERALGEASEGDLSFFDGLLEAIQQPYLEDERYKIYQSPPGEEMSFLRTYCET